MKEKADQLEQLLERGSAYLSLASEMKMNRKPSPEKWSKKEILGHLIDSGINNLQRFTEIQFEKKPYKIRHYNQSGLVKANHYQESDLKEITNLWLALNHRILVLMNNQTEDALNSPIEIAENELSDLRFLMTDYVDHLEYHLNQILRVEDSE